MGSVATAKTKWLCLMRGVCFGTYLPKTLLSPVPGRTESHPMGDPQAPGHQALPRWSLWGKRKMQTMRCMHLSKAAERRGSHDRLCLLSELSSAPRAPGTLTLSPEQPRALPGRPLQAPIAPLGSTHRAQPHCPPVHHAAPRLCTGKGRETCLLRKPCFLWLEGGDVPLVSSACCVIFSLTRGALSSKAQFDIGASALTAFCLAYGTGEGL